MVSSGSSAHCVAPVCETNHALFGSRKSTYTVVQICGTTSTYLNRYYFKGFDLDNDYGLNLDLDSDYGLNLDYTKQLKDLYGPYNDYVKQLRNSYNLSSSYGNLKNSYQKEIDLLQRQIELLKMELELSKLRGKQLDSLTTTSRYAPSTRSAPSAISAKNKKRWAPVSSVSNKRITNKPNPKYVRKTSSGSSLSMKDVKKRWRPSRFVDIEDASLDYLQQQYSIYLGIYNNAVSKRANYTTEKERQEQIKNYSNYLSDLEFQIEKLGGVVSKQHKDDNLSDETYDKFRGKEDIEEGMFFTIASVLSILLSVMIFASGD